MILPRSSGVLLHPTSLPGRYGIGSLDAAAYRWVDLLAEMGQSVWQVLPLGPTGYGDSPYQSFSSFAGNPNLIGLESMVEEGLLDRRYLEEAPAFPDREVDYGKLYRWKPRVLERAAEGLRSGPLLEEFEAFCAEEAAWLDDFALFMALKEAHRGRPWTEWDWELRGRHPAALERARRYLAGALRREKFNQWVFFRQWKRLKAYANRRGIALFGDLPIFVAMDSVDAWKGGSRFFFFDQEMRPTVVAGVPPDYFAADGQLWGNPLYRWEAMQRDGYRWWIHRVQAAFRQVDLVRIDHFRGFAAYWEIPAGAETAREGRWVEGPGEDFFHILIAELGDLPIVVEDLGEITPDVHELRDRFRFPGMKVMQFAFGEGPANPFLPHNHAPQFVVYCGTHDNDTTRGWYETSSTEHERDHFRRYFGCDGRDPARTMVRAGSASVARLFVATLQDLLDLGSEARMNLPGQASGWWRWRFRLEQVTPEVVGWFRECTELYGRVVSTGERDRLPGGGASAPAAP